MSARATIQGRPYQAPSKDGIRRTPIVVAVMVASLLRAKSSAANIAAIAILRIQGRKVNAPFGSE